MTIGVSECLLGRPVRWDGSDFGAGLPRELQDSEIHLVGICPEVGIGLGVPRPPIHLVRRNGTLRAVAVAESTLDYTDELAEQAGRMQRELARLDGYVFAEKSPSCGLRGVKVTDALDGTVERDGRGVYSAAVMQRFPGMPAADARDLVTRTACEAFLRRARDYSRLRSG